MIHVLFRFGNEKILITIDKQEVYFSNTSFGAQRTTIDGLQLNREGVIKEFPDLAKSEDWRKEAAFRFTEKVKGFNSEQEVADYLIEDLRKYGYIPEQIQREGFRPEKIELI